MPDSHKETAGSASGHKPSVWIGTVENTLLLLYCFLYPFAKENRAFWQIRPSIQPPVGRNGQIIHVTSRFQ